MDSSLILLFYMKSIYQSVTRCLKY